MSFKGSARKPETFKYANTCIYNPEEITDPVRVAKFGVRCTKENEKIFFFNCWLIDNVVVLFFSNEDQHNRFYYMAVVTVINLNKNIGKKIWLHSLCCAPYRHVRIHVLTNYHRWGYFVFCTQIEKFGKADIYHICIYLGAQSLFYWNRYVAYIILHRKVNWRDSVVQNDIQ